MSDCNCAPDGSGMVTFHISWSHPERSAEVPADEGTLRERLAHKYHDERCTSWACSEPVRVDFNHADELLALFATELQKARAEGYADGVFDGAKAQSHEDGASL